MAITSTEFQSPATARVGLIPSVYDKIILVGANDTPIMSMIGTSVVKGITHSWITDTLKKPSKNAQLEISEFKGEQKSTKQQNTNATQIFTTDIMVSQTMQEVATYGGKELENEVAKATKVHKLDIEYALLGLGRDASAKVSVLKAPQIREATKPGEMAGLFYYAAKGETAFKDKNGRKEQGNIIAFGNCDANKWGTGECVILTEDILHQVLQRVWESGATPKDIFIGAELKKALNKMASRQFSNEKFINSSVVSLDTDFGKVNFRLHRFLSKEYGLEDCLIAGDFSYAKMGLLKPTFLSDVSTDKTAIAKRYYTEGCLEVRNADAFAIGVGLKAE
ncbi:SU10 major capsid protein [Campylobacter hyointestinalis]|uniref:SU10 major capsid protein n=1 Tax=Campylobacter hyointestinalis TaxID=198 RepID=UPI000DCC2478|nr:DUF5309 family protein [Campylobacter hyointestinalis]RAZ38052.1 hypothetical protein CHL9426_07205 [Campylobacter hyointestinalis subsp. lawsonii]RAZ54643.1 hypothetical protein CHL10074_06635 [Campylobacter hyointestinalis subsp. lawsonii]RAZ63373.1 hypothetical protein CHL9767_06990 [Campylobacter hyointestinalis subsp. lawsonii]